MNRRTPERALLLFALLVAGCGGGEQALHEVRGQVFYKGQPLNGGTIVFTPDPQRGGSGPLAVAEIDRDGRYHLKTGEKAGASAGWHQVTIASAGRYGELPGRYRDPEASGQRAEVKATRTEPYHFYLE